MLLLFKRRLGSLFPAKSLSCKASLQQNISPSKCFSSRISLSLKASFLKSFSPAKSLSVKVSLQSLSLAKSLSRKVYLLQSFSPANEKKAGMLDKAWETLFSKVSFQHCLSPAKKEKKAGMLNKAWESLSCKC